MGFTLYIDLYHSTLYAKQDCAVPNITGVYPNAGSKEVQFNPASGAFYTTANTYLGNQSNAGTGSAINFDASRCSSVYKSVSEVRPENYSINYFIKY